MLNIYQAKGSTLDEQYFDVGALFGESIRASVLKLAKKRSRESQTRKRVAESVLHNLKSRNEAAEFLAILSSWSSGAKIEIEQAMWLLADNLSGCQTMMVRYASGVAIMHTEEEFIDDKHIDLHMTRPHTISFTIDNKICKTLVYNDLLPGCGLFCWKDGMMVAIDSLFLKEEGIEKVHSPLLANVVSWLIWRMNPSEAEPKEILKLIESLGEVIDGYAINIVRKVAEHVVGYKLTIVRSDNKIEYLSDEIGDYLCQTNIVDPKYLPMKYTMSPRNIWRGGWKYFNDRLRTMDKHVRQYRQYATYSLGIKDYESVHTAIQKTIFGKLSRAYVNPDLGAVCIGLLDLSSQSVSCKLNDKKLKDDLEYIDLV